MCTILCIKPSVCKSIWDIKSNGNKLFTVVSPGKVYLSTDLGLSWVNRSEGLPQSEESTLFVYKDYLFSAHLYGPNVYVSTDEGQTWILKNEGLKTDPYANNVYSFAAIDDYVFVGDSYGICRAKLSDLVSDVKDNSSNTADIDFYPNPASDFINVPAYLGWEYQVYDLLGNCVLSGLIDSESINVSALSTGFYTIRIYKEGKQFVGKVMKQ